MRIAYGAQSITFVFSTIWYNRIEQPTYEISNKCINHKLVNKFYKRVLKL